MLPTRVARTLGRPTKPFIEHITGDINRPEGGKSPFCSPRRSHHQSGGGLDPHILREATLFQVPPVAKASNMSEDRLRQLVEGRTLGILGRSRVNVLALSLALDRAAPR